MREKWLTRSQKLKKRKTGGKTLEGKKEWWKKENKEEERQRIKDKEKEQRTKKIARRRQATVERKKEIEQGRLKMDNWLKRKKEKENEKKPPGEPKFRGVNNIELCHKCKHRGVL